MTLRTITYDDEQWQVVPRRLPGAMIDTINGHIDADSDAVALWRDALIDAPEPETCFCDEKGIGDPAKSCGDCPEDYGIPTVRANPEPPAQQPMVDFDIAIAAGDGTLHGAIDHWQERALTAEAKLAAQQPMTEEEIETLMLTTPDNLFEWVRAVEMHHGIGKGDDHD